MLSSAEPRAINVDSTAMAKKLRALEPRDLALAVDLDLEHAWRVEYVDRGGHGYRHLRRPVGGVAARDYYDAIERGALNSRIADAELTTASALVSLPKKRRLMR